MPNNKDINSQESNNSIANDNFILIKAGSFMMGSDEWEDEQPIHKVTIGYDFYLSKYQVTFDEYDLFCEETNIDKHSDKGWGRGKRPAINISWEDATAYCKWRSKKEGKTYRLPTEAEWKYSCKAGSSSRWSFGDNNLDLTQYAWYDKNCFNKGEGHDDYGTHPVGSKKPNPWGLYDMHGNVWEWCEDWYFDSYQNAPVDGSANEYGKQEYKVLCGGSWVDNDLYTRSALRYWVVTDLRSGVNGFRLLLQKT